MLSKLAYLTLRRSIQLLALAARGEPPRTWRSWCCATSLPSCVARSRVPGWNQPTGPCSPRSTRVLPRARWSCFFGQPETLLRLLVAGLVGHGVKDLWQHRSHYVANTRWWPPFCLVVDWVVAAILVVLIAVGVDFHH
jgi:hypothetical protein